MRLAGLAKGGYYPTPLRCVDLVSEQVNIIRQNSRQPAEQETLRIIDPCCGPGDACERLAARLSVKTGAEIKTFGVELERDRAEQAREQMDFALSSDIFQTMIANEAFHILWLNPPYDHDQEDKRVEHAFLVHCTRFLTAGGLLMLVVPRHRLAVSARHLAANYSNLACLRFPDPEYDDFDQVILMGNRKVRTILDEYAERNVLEWARCPLEEMDDLESGPLAPKMYAPTGDAGQVLFTIRRVDPARAAAEAVKSGLWTSQAIEDSLWPSHTAKAQPLMPLRQGHMAMLVAAGFLDNLQLEAGGKRILVKGRTVKKMECISFTEEEEIWQDRMYTTIRTLDMDTGEIEDVQTAGKAAKPETEGEDVEAAARRE